MNTISTLKEIFEQWSHDVPTDYGQQQWLLSKWEVYEGVPWPRGKFDMMLQSIKDNLQIKHDGCLIDLGCGGGWILRSLQECVSSAYGLDFAQGMLRSAHRMFLDGRLVCAEIGNLPFRDGTFDYVLSYFVFLNVINDHYIEKSLKEIIRVLRKGGRALIGQMPDKAKSPDYEQAKESYLRYCQKNFRMGKNMREIHRPPSRLFDKSALAAFLASEKISYELLKSFNPFYREGEPSLIDWRFDLLLKR